MIHNSVYDQQKTTNLNRVKASPTCYYHCLLFQVSIIRYKEEFGDIRINYLLVRIRDIAYKMIHFIDSPRLCAGRLGVRIPAGKRDFFFQIIQTGSGAQ